uniref:Lipid-binding serum glycoprotein N-terminal domain-containing protein n=1 Tax=Homalodisca liturata TaxID=320908 RepID=A0A1B6H9J0_9HEMI
MTHLFLTVLLIVSGTSTFINADDSEKVNINDVVDVLIQDATNSFKETNSGSVAVPDLERTFKKSFLKGGVKATRGVFSDLTTLKRTGNATLTLSGDSATVKVLLGLGKMQLEFGHCRAWISKLSTSDRLSINVNRNSIEVKITITIDGDNCKTTLDDARINEFGDLKVVLKNLGKVKFIADRLVDWIVNHFDGKIRAALESKLKSALEKELKKHNLCSLIK